MINKQFLRKDLQSKWCSTCQSYQEHIGGTLCAGCVLEEDDIEWYIENVEPRHRPTPPKPLVNVKEGDSIFLSDGTKTTAKEVTSRSVKTDRGSFVKSNGTGWGSNELDAAI